MKDINCTQEVLKAWMSKSAQLLFIFINFLILENTSSLSKRPPGSELIP